MGVTRHRKLPIEKICYDNIGKVPNKGRNFNTQTSSSLGKCIYLLFVWLAVIGLRQNYFYILPNFGDFRAKMSFFHYIINQKRNNFIKHCSPQCTKKPLISEVCIYIKSSLCKWGLGTRGGGGWERCSIDKKSKGCRLTTHKIHYSQWKIASIVNFLIKAWNFALWYIMI